MSLSELEQHVLAYYVANGAKEFAMVGRFFPYGELKLVIADKIQVATRKFGRKATMVTPTVAAAFLDLMIERGAFSTKTNEFGGTMHQFQAKEYQELLKDRQASDPIIQKAQAGGADYWQESFAELTGTAAAG